MIIIFNDKFKNCIEKVARNAKENSTAVNRPVMVFSRCVVFLLERSLEFVTCIQHRFPSESSDLGVIII